MWNFAETHSGHVEISLKLAIFVVSSQIFYFSGHAGKKQVVNRACCAAEFAFCCTVRIALQNSQRALICHRVPAQPGGGPGGGIAKKNLSKFPEVDIPQSRNSLKPKFPKVKSPPQKKMKRFKETLQDVVMVLVVVVVVVCTFRPLADELVRGPHVQHHV